MTRPDATGRDPRAETPAGAVATRPRQLTRAEMDDLAAARLLALDLMPYLATALFEVIPVRAAGLGTFAVDAEWRLYIDPDALKRWGPYHAAGVLLHEVGHLLRAHHDRHDEHPRTDGLLWNLAADAEINDDLIAAGVPLPGDPVTPSALDEPDEQLAEHYFAHLLELRDQAVLTDPACGSGAGGTPAPCELDDEDHPGRSKLDQELVRRKVAHDIATGTATGPLAGTVPGGWHRWATTILEPPTIAWRQLLRRTVRRSLAVKAGQLDTSYRRPGRRRIPHVITPGMIQPVLRVGVVLDSSFSMADGQLRAALSELDGICRRSGVGPNDLVVVTADVAVHEVPRLRRATDLPITGGGGTDLRPALAHVATHRRRPHTIIVLTDGFTPWPHVPPAPGASTIAVLIARTDGLTPVDPPSWIDTIHISPGW